MTWLRKIGDYLRRKLFYDHSEKIPIFRKLFTIEIYNISKKEVDMQYFQKVNPGV